MTDQQIKWATQHDWFVRALPNGAVIAKDRYTTPSGRVHIALRRFINFRELRQWAGY